MSDSSSDRNESGSGSGSGSDVDSRSGSGSGSCSDSGSRSGSDSGSGSNRSGSDSGSGSGSGSNSGSSDSGKKKKKRQNVIDEDETMVYKPKLSVFFELQNVMKSILYDMEIVDKKVTEIEMRFNPKPIVVIRPPSPPRRAVSQDPPESTRNYFPPGFTSGQMQPEPMPKSVLK